VWPRLLEVGIADTDREHQQHRHVQRPALPQLADHPAVLVGRGRPEVAELVRLATGEPADHRREHRHAHRRRDEVLHRQPAIWARCDMVVSPPEYCQLVLVMND
jgi:hypothetical protein